ncbi:MAG TPA: DUF4142 domain-containing protein [Frateuria sp.]|uniref:DUF4142 domain-containing protein n=1 Tax=Frateuria sp. TaxID=2211372 RepID=UPI002D80BCF8|nr:DUF4142 domain-containing protein [Frateuria sp.]HET6807119.1 DUF4142 domain-containing protein [Frateuria sp.]
MNLRRATMAASSALLLAAATPAFAGHSSSTMQHEATDKTAFMKKVASDGMAEVQICQLALRQSNDAQLKQVAQRLMDDHTQANQQLQQIAQSEGVSLPAELMPEDQQKVQKLQGKSGKAFDKQWIQMNLTDHRKDIKLFSMAGKELKDQPTRQFAQETLPKLKTHLQLVEQLTK